MPSLQFFKIETPIWNERAVGVAEYKIGDKNLIEIMAEDKYGNRIYPDVYMADREQLMNGRVVYAEKGDVKLRVVPISELEIAK